MTLSCHTCMLWHKAVCMTLTFELSEITYEPSMTTHFIVFIFRNTSMMLQAAQDTFLGVWKQSRGRFVEDLHCHQIALLTFPQEAQISKGLLMLKGSLMGMLAKRPCLCSSIPQTIPWCSRRWERPFSTVRSLCLLSGSQYQIDDHHDSGAAKK